MRTTWNLVLVVALAVGLAVSCGSNSLGGTGGTGGAGAQNGATGGAGAQNGATGGATGGTVGTGGCNLGGEWGTRCPPGTGGGATATGGMGGIGGAGCEYQHYFTPGCGADVAPRCTGAGGACLSFACGCDGRILTGCGNEFAAPYAYTFPVSEQTLDGGLLSGTQTTCDPTSDAGH
jgi:hypothetical protein